MAKAEKKTKRRSKFAGIMHRLKKNKAAMISLVVLIIVLLVGIFGQYIAPYRYDEQDYSLSYAKPSREHLLGCDQLGRDIFSRLIYATKQSLQLGILATGIAAVIGVTIGCIAGFYGGWVDNLLMRLLDIYQSVPMFLLCVSLAAVMGPSLRNAVLAIGIATVPLPARLMRASILTVRSQEYIEASRMCNASSFRLIVSHIIPNAIAPIIVSVTMTVGMNILSGASLSYIGLGAQPPIPEWGAMVADARNVMRDHAVLAAYPGICIMITVLACNLLGDGLRDALDPRLKN